MSSRVWQRLGPPATKSGSFSSNNSRPPQYPAAEKGNQVCKHFIRGNCAFGDKCRNLHTSLAQPVAKEVCRFWAKGNCKYGDKCKNLHTTAPESASESAINGFSSITELEGHQQAIIGIALSSDKMYTGSEDRTVRAWLSSGQCAGTLNMDGEIGCMIGAGPWVFVGMNNLVKAWNFEANVEMNLVGPTGQVKTLVTSGDLLCAGVQDGAILVWRFNVETNTFEPAASLMGHSSAVVTLAAGPNNLLYSGSTDTTVKIWNLEKRGTVECEQTLAEHFDVITSVMSMMLSDHYFLLSSSLDGTVNVWMAGNNGSFELQHTKTVGLEVLALCGMMNDLEGKQTLLCSCSDNAVRVYDLPSFSERGKICTKREVRSIQVDSIGTLFTGDGAGLVQIWKWSTSV